MPQAHQTSRDPVARTIEGLEGRSYGPFPLRVCREKVAEFVEITGDDPARWLDVAPPGWAAAALFVVAPRLLSEPDLEDIAGSVIHGEQRFFWECPLAVEAELKVTGRIERIRERSGTWLVGFELVVEDDDDQGVLRGSSTFLMSGTTPPGGGGEASEPRSALFKERGQFSASRSDLIRYAAATRDWNPIHWDHQSALAAGLPGIVVHGLLQAAWIMRAVTTTRTGPAPLREARFRFRAPLLAGYPARMAATMTADLVEARLLAGEQELVAASLMLR